MSKSVALSSEHPNIFTLLLPYYYKHPREQRHEHSMPALSNLPAQRIQYKSGNIYSRKASCAAAISWASAIGTFASTSGKYCESDAPTPILMARAVPVAVAAQQVWSDTPVAIPVVEGDIVGDQLNNAQREIIINARWPTPSESWGE